MKVNVTEVHGIEVAFEAVLFLFFMRLRIVLCIHCYPVVISNSKAQEGCCYWK